MKLYELADSYKNLAELLEMDEFEGNADIEQALNDIEGQLEDKVQNIVYLIKNSEADILALDAEEKRLKARKVSKKAQVDRVKDWLRSTLEQLAPADKGFKVQTALFNVSLSKPSLNNLDESIDMDLIPERFKKVEIKPDKVALKKALKEGEVIEGARLVESRSFSIR